MSPKSRTSVEESGGAIPLSKRRVVIALLALLMLIPLLLPVVFLVEAPRLQREAFRHLRENATVKATQLEHWLNDRHEHALKLARDPGFIASADSFLHKEGTLSESALSNRLDAFKTSYRYEAVALLDSDERPHLVLGNANVDTLPLPNSGKGIMGYRFDGRPDDSLHFRYPLLRASDSSAVGYLWLKVGVESYLHPHISDWVSASRRGETLVVLEHEGRVAYVTPLRHRTGEIGSFTMPLTASDLAAAEALRRGGSGLLEGRDYRGADVLVAHQPVTGTNWQLIAKVDRAEVMEPLARLFTWIGVIAAVSVGVFGASLLVVWKRQKRLHLRDITSERNQRHRLLDLFFDLPFVGMAISSPATKRWVHYNDTLCEILGYPRDELAEKRWTELTHPDDLEQNLLLFGQVMRGEREGFAMDKRFIHKDGRIIFTNIDVKCVRCADGSVDYFVSMIQDIDERKRWEQALDESRTRSQHYLDVAGVMMLSLDVEGTVQMANRQACQTLGYDESELVGCNWFVTCLPESIRSVERNHFEKLMAGEVQPAEYVESEIQVRSGEKRLIAWRTTLLRNAAGDINGVLASGTDITVQHQMQVALADHEAWLRTLVRTIPDLVWLKDADGVFLACNPAFERFFGASEAEIVGNTDHDFVDHDLADSFRKHDRRAMVAGEPCINEEALVFAKDGYQGDFETVKTPMISDEGKLIGILGVARDITRRKRDTERIGSLTRLYATLSETNEAVLRCKDENSLLRRMCQIAVEQGGFKLAWSGLVDGSRDRVEPVVAYGEEVEHLQDLKVSTDPNSSFSKGPTGRALREGVPCWCEDFIHDPATAPWHEWGRRVGCGMAAALPLRRRGVIVGSISLYAAAGEMAFDQSARGLLVKIADNISFALDILESERDRKLAEERLELAMEGSRDAPWDWDLLADRFWYSAQWWRMLGHRPEDMVAGPPLWRELAHPDDLPAVDRGLSNIIESGAERGSVECRFLCSDGHYVPTLIRGVARRDESGRVVRLSGTTTDLTQQKRVEAELRRQRDELAHAHRVLDSHLENSPLAIVECDPDFRIVRWSCQAEKLFGWSEAEALGKHPSEFPFVHPEDLSAVSEVFSALIEGEPRSFSVNRNCTRQGDSRDVEWYNSALRDEQGNLLSILSLAHDITDRTEAQEALRNRENLLQKLYEILPVGLWLADREGRLLQANPAGLAIWGAEPLVAPEEYGVFRARRLPSGEPVAGDDWALAHTVREGITVRDELLEIEAFDGETKVILNYTAPVLDDSGELEGAVVVNLDVTERENTYKQLQRQLDELNQWCDLTLEREERVLELKEEVNRLLRQSGRPEKYRSVMTDEKEEE